MFVFACVAMQGKDYPCGIYMPEAFWWQEGYPDRARWAFKCEIMPQKIKDCHPEMYENMKEGMKGIPDHEWNAYTGCCGAKFIPWAWGASKVVELTICGETHAILAERLPDQLDDEIKRMQYAFHKACGRVTAEQIMAAVPLVLPKVNLCKGCPIPGIARFDFVQWKKEREPTILHAGWIALIKVICVNADDVDLSKIITKCDELAIKEETDPDLKTAMIMSKGWKHTKRIKASGSHSPQSPESPCWDP